MRVRAPRKAIYASMAVAVVALTAGYALGQLQLGQKNVVQQGSETTTVHTVVGLEWDSTSLLQLDAGDVPTSACGASASSACDVAGQGANACGGGLPGNSTCTEGTWVEQVNLSTVLDTAFTGKAGGENHTVAITVYVTNTTGTYSGTTLYYAQASSSNPAVTILQDFGVGSSGYGPEPVLTVTVLASG